MGITPDGSPPCQSQRELSKKYKISRYALGLRCKREGWVKQREQYQASLRAQAGQKAIEKAADVMGDKLAKVNEHGLEGALEMMQASRLLLGLYFSLYKVCQERMQSGLSPEDKDFVCRLSQVLAVLLKNAQQSHKGGLEAARLALEEPTHITKTITTYEELVRDAIAYLEGEYMDDDSGEHV